MNTDQLKEYAKLKIEEKAIKARIDELNPLILEDIQKSGADEVPTSMGTFTLSSRRTYKYPDEIVNMELSLKEKKTEAEAKGTATPVDKEYIIFKAAVTE